jgi:hypothetical protein
MLRKYFRHGFNDYSLHIWSLFRNSLIRIVFILFFLFVYLNSPADHLTHRRGPQVGKRCIRVTINPTFCNDSI